MKSLVATSSSSDSTALLYHMLKKTDDEIVSIMLTNESKVRSKDVSRYPLICEWLEKNVRSFEYKQVNDDVVGSNLRERMNSKNGIIASYGNHFGVDRICFGFNLFNWGSTNWYFQHPNEPIESYYEHEHREVLADNFSASVRGVWKGSIEWPFMSRSSRPKGRWEINESIPEDLKALVSICFCGRSECRKCRAKKFYLNRKSQGMTGREIDDEIMRLGKYGKYYEESATRADYDAVFYLI